MSEQTEPLGALENQHVAPEFDRQAFHCIHCGVLSQQGWEHLFVPPRYYGQSNFLVGYSRCTCQNCGGTSVWNEIEKRCVDPNIGGGPRPHVDTPADVKADYEEARRIVVQSPRGACALLRLGVQKLCADLGEPGKDINTDIASLVKKGLSQDVQEAMDAVRVIGNESVHPGALDLKDDLETATALFGLLNYIVQDQIAEPKQRKAIFNLLPKSKRDAIAKRDGVATAQPQSPKGQVST